jgi:hypothetical protein
MDTSRYRREQNEAAFRVRNDQLKAAVDTVLPEENKADLNIAFTCECSNEFCTAGVQLSASKYEQVRRHPRQFIIVPGHEQRDIEAVVEFEGYAVAEKYDQPPPTDGRLNRTH